MTANEAILKDAVMTAIENAVFAGVPADRVEAIIKALVSCEGEN